MLTDAEDHQFDIIIAEDIDRLARGEGDAPKLRQRLEFLGIEMHTCTDGHITKLHAGLKGLMSSLFLDNLIAHTKRGMAGVVRDGRHPGRQNIWVQYYPHRDPRVRYELRREAIFERKSASSARSNSSIMKTIWEYLTSDRMLAACWAYSRFRNA